MDNSKAELRKWEDNLNVGGLGIIVLGAWSVVRAIMEVFINLKEVSMEIRNEFAAKDRMLGYAVMAVMLLALILLCVILMLIHLYIGLNAMKAARDQEYKKGYFVWAIIMLVLIVISMISYADLLKDSDDKLLSVLASMLVDLTTIYTFILVIRSTLKMKQLKQS